MENKVFSQTIREPSLVGIQIKVMFPHSIDRYKLTLVSMNMFIEKKLLMNKDTSNYRMVMVGKGLYLGRL